MEEAGLFFYFIFHGLAWAGTLTLQSVQGWFGLGRHLVDSSCVGVGYVCADMAGSPV